MTHIVFFFLQLRLARRALDADGRQLQEGRAEVYESGPDHATL